MRNIGPIGLVIGAKLDSRPRLSSCSLIIGRRSGPPSARRCAVRDAACARTIESDLPHHRIQHVLDLGGEHGTALRRIRRVQKQGAEGQHFAEDRSGFGQGQRRRRHQRAIRASQNLMHACPSSCASVITSRGLPGNSQHIRMRGGHRRMREGARLLARPHRRIDPALVEEALGDSAIFGEKAS